VNKLVRPYESYTGEIRFIPMEFCRCRERRGPAGGCCGVCGDAIPNQGEQARINRMEDAMMADPKYDPNKKPDDAPKDNENTAEKKKKPEHEDEEEEEEVKAT
jgi:hypothetical protein